MAREFAGTLPYLMAVNDRFGDQWKQNDEFHRIYSDFKNKVDGDEIIHRSKELFDGDKMMVMGFYRLLLEQNRKKKRSGDIGDVLMRVCGLMNDETPKSFSEILYMAQKNDFTLDASQEMGENKRPRSKSRKRRCMKKDSREDSKGNDNAKILYNGSGHSDNTHLMQKNPQGVVESLVSSNDHESNMTGFLRTEGRIASSGNYAKERETFMVHDISDGHKARVVKHKKIKVKIRLGEQHSPDSNNATYQKASLPADGKEYRKSVSEVGFSSRQTCTPSYRVLPEKCQHTELNSSVLNDCCVLVNKRVYSSKAKPNQCEDILFKCEDDMFELDMLLGSVKATIKSVKEIITTIPDKKTHPDFQFHIEKYLTSSNLRCIVNLYDTNWQDTVDAIRQNAEMMSIVLRRLEQREKELECYRLDFHKLCRGVFAENIPKLYNR